MSGTSCYQDRCTVVALYSWPSRPPYQGDSFHISPGRSESIPNSLMEPLDGLALVCAHFVLSNIIELKLFPTAQSQSTSVVAICVEINRNLIPIILFGPSVVESWNFNMNFNSHHRSVVLPIRLLIFRRVLLLAISTMEIVQFSFAFQRVGWRLLFFLFYTSLICDFMHLKQFLLLPKF